MDDIATKDSWKTSPMSPSRMEIPFDLRLTHDEFNRLKHGYIPEMMEDKWFIYQENEWVYFHRSWTGYCIYQIRFVPEGSQFVCREAWVTRDANQYHNHDIEEDKRILKAILFYRFEIGTQPV